MLNFNPNSDDTNGNGTPGGPTGTGTPVTPHGNAPWQNNGANANDPAMDLLINYNEKFKNAGPTLYRDEIIKQTLSCLIGKFKPNALLIGAAGVGKTKIVEDIARRIANNDPLIPQKLKKSTIWELPISNIIAGSGFVGDVEAKTKAILDFASDTKNDVILFIDEIHMLVDSGSKEYSKIAQIMKPALARGDIRVIGATTLQESQSLMNDPAFNRRFTRLIVDELSQEQTQVILEQMIPMFYEHYNKEIAVDTNTIALTIKTADEFKTLNAHRPDNAITLLDRTMAETLIKRQALKEKAIRENNQGLLASLPPETLVSKKQLNEVATKLMTGNNKPIDMDFKKLVHELSVIKGQNDSLNIILDVIQRHQLKLTKQTKPLTFLLAGNSGVGKTEAAKIMASHLTGTEPIILNMTEFHSPASINRIIGAPAGYVGYDSNGELPFDILESNPNRIILLDEFEKADQSVQKLFMSAFDEGYIKTAKGKIIDFSRSIIIATTNAGCEETSAKSIGFMNSSTKKNGEAYYKILSRYFDMALLNRFTKITQFNPITEDLFREILVDKYKREAKRILTEHPSYTFIAPEIPDTDAEELTKENYNTLFGARPISRLVQKYIEDAVVANRTSIVYMEDAENDADIADDDTTDTDSAAVSDIASDETETN